MQICRVTFWGFDHIEDKPTLYRGRDWMKKFCTSLTEHTKNIIDFEKKNVTVNKRRTKPHQDARCNVILMEKEFQKSFLKDNLSKI